MQKVSYIYGGETRTFYFNFPYFEKSNIVVTVDNKPAPAYNVIGNKGGSNPDFPFTSGRIVFEKPLNKFETITIERHLPLVRPVDFQPLARITSTMLNQDMNYTMELLKDVRDDLDTFHQNYADIVDKESTELRLSKIDLVNQNIADMSEHLDVFDSIPLMQTAIESLQSTVATLTSGLSNCTNSIDLLNTKTTEISDYVIHTQEPNAGNDYIWYRKYKSNWVEMGGSINPGQTITLPVEMADANYTLASSFGTSSSTFSPYWSHLGYTKTATSIKLAASGISQNWLISGFSAT